MVRKKFGIVPIKDELDRAFEDIATAMENFRRNFTRMFKEPFLEEGEELGVFEPSADLVDKGDAYEITVDMPGIDKENIEINLTEDEIEIKGERKKEEKEEGKNYVRRERSYRSFYRVMSLPEEILPDQSEAKMENGILKVTLKKKHPTPIKKKEVKRIPVQ